MLKDDALEAADTAIRATDPALADLCDALRWTAADGDIQAITAVTGVWTPRGLLLTATVTIAAGPSDTKVIEHVPLSLVQGGPLLEYVTKDPEALTAALVTRWSPSHVPISVSRLRSQVFKGLYTAREQPPPIDTSAPPDIQSQKVSHKIHKPISQFPAPHLRPSWDRLRTREVVAAFWALPNDVHAVLQEAHIPTADLVPLKFGLLAWASSVCLTGQYTPAPVPTPPALANKGMWTPEQLRPLLECSVLPIRSVELLHQIEQAGEHSWATSPTFALLQAGIADTASPPPLTPPSHAPYLTKGQAAPSPAGTLFATAAFTPASALYKSQDKPTPSGSEPSPSSLLPEQTRLSFNLPEPASQVPPVAADPTPPESPAPAVGSAPPSPSQMGEPFVPDLDVTAYSTDYAQLRDEYEAQQQELAVARSDLESLTRDLDMVRTERDNAQQQTKRSAAAQRQAQAVRLNSFIRSIPPLLSIATRLRGLQSTPPAFANAVRSAVLASFELLAPGSQQFPVLVPVILAAAVLTSPQAANLEELADVLRRAMAAPSTVPVPQTPARAPGLSFAVPDPIPKPKAVSAFRAPGATAQPPSPTAPPTMPPWPPCWSGSRRSPRAVRTTWHTRSTSSSSVSTTRTSAPSRSRRFGNSGPGSAAMRPACPASRKSCAPSSPTPLRSNGLLTVQPPPQPKLQPPTRHRAQRKRRGIHPKKLIRRPSRKRCGSAGKKSTIRRPVKLMRDSSVVSLGINLAQACPPLLKNNSIIKPNSRLSESDQHSMSEACD